MAQITLSELKTHAGRYISQVENNADEEIYITRRGQRVAKIVTAKPDKVAAAKALFGILPTDANLDKAKEERFQ